MAELVVEEHVGTVSTQEFALVEPAEEQGFVDPYSPCAQGAYHTLVRRRRAGGHQRGTNRAGVVREFVLQALQCGQERLERPPAQRFACGSRFAARKLSRNPFA